MRSSSGQEVGAGERPEPAGPFEEAVGPVDVEELERILSVSGVRRASLARRYSVVFVFPGIGLRRVDPSLAGCTEEVCAFVEEAPRFSRRGIHLIGLSTEASHPPDGTLALPFRVGRLPLEELGGLLEATGPGSRYAARVTFVLAPGGRGIRISGIQEPGAHAARSLDMATRSRVHGFRAALPSHGGTCTPPDRSVDRWDADRAGPLTRLSGLLPGAQLACRMGPPHAIAAEGRRIQRLNWLLETNGYPPMFPNILALREGEDPGWYLMEAPDPLPQGDPSDARPGHWWERPAHGARLQWFVGEAVRTLGALHGLTARTSELPCHPYLLGRSTWPGARSLEAVVGRALGTDSVLDRAVVLRARGGGAGSFVCRPYREQVRALRGALATVSPPVRCDLHGEPRLAGLVPDRAGRLLFLPPRRIGAGGRGDPMADQGYLLQDVHVGRVVDRAVAEGDGDRLLSVERGSEALGVTTGLLELEEDEVRWFLRLVHRSVPAPVRGQAWRTRLHVAASGALLGCLLCRRPPGSEVARAALYVGAVWHLEMARRAFENRSGRG
ncbi:hypothetical protein BH20ACT24_BH20ACT24_07820 [soil metagenome]